MTRSDNTIEKLVKQNPNIINDLDEAVMLLNAFSQIMSGKVDAGFFNRVSGSVEKVTSVLKNIKESAR